jgi:hypothetical protein
MPVVETVPGEALHVTATLGVLLTSAVKSVDVLEATLAVVGVMLIATAAFTVRVRDCVEVCLGEEESVTSMAKLNVPLCEVVPEIDPADCTAIPLGNEPEASDQV